MQTVCQRPAIRRRFAAVAIAIAAAGALLPLSSEWIGIARPAAALAAEPRADEVLPRGAAPSGPRTLADLVEQGRGGAADSLSPAGEPFTSPQVAGQRQPIPPVDRLSAAQRLLDEVFGKKIAAAKTPADKGKLAREIIDAVRGESDPAARYAALVQARILAVEARDGRLALDAVRLLAAEFESDAGPATDGERLARADRLWTEAEHSEGKQRLERQIEAVGEYWRAAPQSGLTASKWEQRIESIAGFGKIVLSAKDAKCVGKVTYQRQLDSIGAWDQAADFVEWVVTLQAGEYLATLTYANGQTGKPGIIGVSVFYQSQQRPFKTLPLEVTPTLPPGGFTFVEAQAGRLTIPKTGDYRIVAHAVQMRQKWLIQLRSITLEPLASASK